MLKHCSMCGAEFTAGRKGRKKYCSDECAKVGYSIRRESKESGYGNTVRVGEGSKKINEIMRHIDGVSYGKATAVRVTVVVPE